MTTSNQFNYITDIFKVIGFLKTPFHLTKIKHLDLTAVTTALLFEQNLDGPSSWLEASLVDVEDKTQSLAHSECNRISSSDKTTPVFSSIFSFISDI